MAKLPEDYVLEDYVIRYFSIDLEGKPLQLVTALVFCELLPELLTPICFAWTASF